MESESADDMFDRLYVCVAYANSVNVSRAATNLNDGKSNKSQNYTFII